MLCDILARGIEPSGPAFNDGRHHHLLSIQQSLTNRQGKLGLPGSIMCLAAVEPTSEAALE